MPGNINRIFLLFFVAIATQACAGDQPKRDSSNTSNKKKETQKKEKMEPIYILNFDIPYPAEIRVNDIVTEINLTESPFSPCNLNTNLVKGQLEQAISIKVYANGFDKGGLIKPEAISKLNSELGVYKYFLKDGEIDNMKLVKKLEFSPISSPVPYIEGRWDFSVDDLGYEIDGWSKSKEVNKLKENDIKKLATDKYNQLAKLLNGGNVEAFVGELAIPNNDFFVSNYFSKDQKAEFLANQKDAYIKMKDRVLPIDSFQMRIMGNGKVVALERMNKRYYGQGVVIAEDRDEKLVYLNYIMLAIPSSNSEEFKVVRINSFVQGVDD